MCFQAFIKTGFAIDRQWVNSILLEDDNLPAPSIQPEKEKETSEEKEADKETEKEVGKDEKKDEVKDQEESQEAKATKVTARLRRFVSIVDALPVEDVNSMLSYDGLPCLIKSCRKLSTDSEIHKLNDMVEMQTQQVNQLWTCLKTALKDSSIALLIECCDMLRSVDSHVASCFPPCGLVRRIHMTGF